MTSAQPPSGEFVLDAVVIGGGFFGCETALELKRLGSVRYCWSSARQAFSDELLSSIRLAFITAITIRGRQRRPSGRGRALKDLSPTIRRRSCAI